MHRRWKLENTIILKGVHITEISEYDASKKDLPFSISNQILIFDKIKLIIIIIKKKPYNLEMRT